MGGGSDRCTRSAVGWFKGDEQGYSLVEVLVSIMILTIAIIPMVGMFDAGLRAASTSGNYDKARALANSNLESVKAMEFSTARNLSSCPRSGSSGFTCSVNVAPVYADAGGQFRNSGVSDPKDMLRVRVTVAWGSGKSFSTVGLVAR